MRIGVRIARFASSLFRSPHFPLLSSTRRLRCNLSPSAASPEVRSRYLLPPSSHLLAFFPCWSLPSFWIARAGKAPYRIVRTGPPADQYTIARYRVVPPKSTALAVDFGRKKKREKKKREKLVPRALLFSDSPARSRYVLCIPLGTGYPTEMNSVCQSGPLALAGKRYAIEFALREMFKTKEYRYEGLF
ncbi:hypothetical protein BHE74_00057150 [Ensete ventricosum]|nr:hypothetical protein BHE74_00057150 [Ensete ventricosum]